MSLIRLQNISRRYQMGSETIYALRDVSLSIERGEYVAGSSAIHSKLQKLVAGAIR